ncbi:MAG: gliding motility-associated C-terminal domain-containing protein [Bacteroidia bacterium]
MNNSYENLNVRKHSPKAVIIAAVLVGVCALDVTSQVSFLNNGITIFNSNNQFVINGDVTHQQEGQIVNSGNFYIRGNWTNENPTNAVFSSGTNGWVHLDSAIQASQNIGGTTVTRFNNLELIGVGARKLDSIDVEIEDTLALNTKDFEAGDNTVFVLSPGTGAVTRSSGFVSSTNDGGLSRNTTASEVYLFPVGSNVGTSRYRPVEITPATDNTFKVRMANVDATTESYDRSNREVTIGDANPNFYHRISSTNSSDAADVTVYYDPVEDGNYQLLAQWDNMWKNIGVVAETTGNNLVGITKYGHTDFSHTPFILAEEMPAVFVANVFSPNGDGNNDILHLLGNSIDELTFTIYDRWGGKVFETTDASVGWDGSFKGKPMNVGVFVYFAKGKFKNGEEFDRSGNVTLLR